MKKRIKALFMGLLMLLVLGSLPMGTQAAEFTLDLPVKILLKGQHPARQETFQIRLKALSPKAPMPEGSQGGSYLMKLTGPGIKNFPAISFDQPGKARYSITQVPGKARYYTYDSTAYELEVIVQNTPAGLEPTVILSREGTEEKAEELVFTNRYDPPSTGQPDTGDPFPLEFWLILAAASLLGALWLGFRIIRKKL